VTEGQTIHGERDALLTDNERASLDRMHEAVAAEVDSAIQKFRLDYASAHEAFGVLLEEVEEFKAQVWLKRAHRSKRDMAGELVQVAAVAIKYGAQLLREIDSAAPKAEG
jgi:NTP pyrophosphatase (non-canonical NTP hydrolase)